MKEQPSLENSEEKVEDKEPSKEQSSIHFHTVSVSPIDTPVGYVKEQDYTFHQLYDLMEDDEEELEEAVHGHEYIVEKRAKREELKSNLLEKMRKVVVKNLGLSRKLQNLTPD